MRGEQYLTRSAQYGLVYERGGTRTSELLVMKVLPNGLDLSRYGLSVSRRVGKAVVRNRTRRRLREILRQVTLKPGWDMIFIVRAKAAGASFSDLQSTVLRLLSRGNLLVE